MRLRFNTRRGPRCPVEGLAYNRPPEVRSRGTSMPAAVRNALVFLLLSGAAALTWFLSRPELPVARQVVRDTTAPIGYYMKNARLAETDDAGRIYYRIFADQVVQASQQDDLVLTEVRVEYDESEDVHWTVSAGRGVAPYDGAYLDLIDKVRLATAPEAGMEQTVIRTDRLRLDVEQYLASSADPVSISRGNAKLNATGLRVDLKEDRIELQHDVTGVFAP
jgi:LPS export ABC transporter protein LptC